MLKQIRPAIVMMVVLTIVTGLVYPLAMTGIAQLVFPRQANGSLIKVGDKVIGSEIIAQGFTKPEYFHPRPSAAGNGYDGTNSNGSQLGPLSQKLKDRVNASVEQFRKENPEYHGPIPSDLLTTSASGLDPHISPDGAAVQVARVAAARGVSADRINQLVAEYTEKASLGFVGEPRVNVLMLNLALDALISKK